MQREHESVTQPRGGGMGVGGTSYRHFQNFGVDKKRGGFDTVYGGSSKVIIHTKKIITLPQRVISYSQLVYKFTFTPKDVDFCAMFVNCPELHFCTLFRQIHQRSRIGGAWGGERLLPVSQGNTHFPRYWKKKNCQKGTQGRG